MEAPRRPDQPALRLLLADDLSPAARRAAALIAGARWPGGTIVRLVTSPIGIGPGLSSFAMLSEARAHAHEVQREIEDAHDRIAADLGEAGLVVEPAIAHGRPERAILGEAKRFAPDLIVVGARGHGSLAATILSSVSRGIVEKAPCSVLVARDPAVSRILLATDGSAAAGLATTMLATWPLFGGVRTMVLGVQDSEAGGGDGGSPDAAERASAVVNAAVAELAMDGRSVEGEIRLGDVATEIVTAARAWAADLVAIGAASEPFLRRLILGTVARKVLDGVPSSVLVARPTGSSDA